jgi:hypothetical protein
VDMPGVAALSPPGAGLGNRPRRGCGLVKFSAMGAEEVSEYVHDTPQAVLASGPDRLRERIGEGDQRAARRTLRAQIARLEGELSDAFVTAFPMGGLEPPVAVTAEPRLLDLGELEVVRDELADRLRGARVRIAERADEQAEKRLALERMLLDPGTHRYTRISCRELGEPGCGVWQVRPRMGLIGMLMGWWQVKLSSGCPLAGGRGLGARGSASPAY